MIAPMWVSVNPGHGDAARELAAEVPTRLRTLPWIRLSIRLSTRSHRFPAFARCVHYGRLGRFVRYADDCNLYVRSRRAGERVMASVTNFLARRLKLTVNAAKSAVDRPSARAFLAFSFTAGPTPQRVISPKALARFKLRVRELTRRTTSVRFTRLVEELSRYLVGWRGYFGFCEDPFVLLRLDQWTRRRLRAVVWKHWKYGRTRFAALRRRGGSARPWRPRPRAAPMARGGSVSARRFASRCPTLSSTGSASHPSPQAMPFDSVEPPCTDPYARWCGRGGAARLPPIPIALRPCG